jgi:hypothetical protein
MKVKTDFIKVAIIWFLIIFQAGYVWSIEPSPKAVIDQTTHEFSPVIAGTEVSHGFILGNQGDAPLNIVGVQAG